MSQTVDTNVLVYATDRAGPYQERARALIEHLVAGPALAYFLWPALLGYLRVATDPRIHAVPLSTDNALSNVANLIAPSHIRTAGEGEDFWRAFQRVAADVKPRGKLVADAHLVALMHDLGISTVWTNDRDFRKFEGISVKDPFEDKYANGFD